MDINDLLAQVPLDQFAAQLGVEGPQAEGIARQMVVGDRVMGQVFDDAA